MPLLAAGNSRHFHPRFALVEMIRGYARWHRANRMPDNRRDGRELSRLTIHLVDQSALLEVTSGRLDVIELPELQDVQFWIEVVTRDGRLERELMFEQNEARLDEIAKQAGRALDSWVVQVLPNPQLGGGRALLSDVREKGLAELGVLSGSTLRFTTVEARLRDGASPSASRRVQPTSQPPSVGR